MCIRFESDGNQRIDIYPRTMILSVESIDNPVANSSQGNLSEVVVPAFLLVAEALAMMTDIYAISIKNGTASYRL